MRSEVKCSRLLRFVDSVLRSPATKQTQLSFHFFSSIGGFPLFLHSGFHFPSKMSLLLQQRLWWFSTWVLLVVVPLVPSVVNTAPSTCSPQTYKSDPLSFIRCAKKSSSSQYASNSIVDFCVVMMPLAFPQKKDNPDPSAPVEYEYQNNTEKDVFRYYGPQAGEVDPGGGGGGGTVDSRLPHFDIIRELGRGDAWSNQRNDDLPYSMGESEQNPNWVLNYPENDAPNPYFVEVSRISLKSVKKNDRDIHHILHGFLHFRIFMNRSVAMGRGQTSREGSLHKRDEKPDNARGLISAAFIMVKDQEGWPIGDFSLNIPCRRSCSEYPTETYYGDKTNALPCAFTPPRATSHPGMFVFDAHPGFYREDSKTAKRPGVFAPTTEEPEEDDGLGGTTGSGALKCECDNAGVPMDCQAPPKDPAAPCDQFKCPKPGTPPCSGGLSGRRKRNIPEGYTSMFGNYFDNNGKKGRQRERRAAGKCTCDPDVTEVNCDINAGVAPVCQPACTNGTCIEVGAGGGPLQPDGPEDGPIGGGGPEDGSDGIEDGIPLFKDEMFNIPRNSRNRGVREVHATWNFNQDSCQFASKLFIQTLILEEVRNPVTPDIEGGTGEDHRPRVYGWTAQYNVLLPTRQSLGAADYVDLEYLRERDSMAPEIDCHVPMFDAPQTFGVGFNKGPVPRKGEGGQSVPTQTAYLRSLMELALIRDKASGLAFNQIPEYFGQHREEEQLCRIQAVGADNSINPIDPAKKEVSPPKVFKFFQGSHNKRSNKALRCPCPALATPLPVENRTTDPTRLHGRLIHASHMTIAYMLLTPLACFVARYYKETFVTVFCFQEYWWYMWHVCFLMIACVFNVGAVLSISLKKGEPIPASKNLLIHKIFGGISIGVFYLEIFTGFCRHADPLKRMRQIFVHWLVGLLNNLCAVCSMFAMAWVTSSGMSCNVVNTIIAWLVFVIVFYFVMEVAMRRGDMKLHLKPKRTYLPPPVVRLFARDAPGQDFRMVMLALFILGLVLFQLAISYFIWNSEGLCCFDEIRLEKEKHARYGGPEKPAAGKKPGGDYDD